jgi:ribosomal protein S18 acetylase RimI-like enzyme
VAIHLSPFEPAIADELVRMWRAAFEFGVGVLDPNPIEAQRAYLFEHVLPEHELRLAFEGERLVGFVASNAESVAQLHVRVGCHGRGIGSELLNAAKAASAGSLWLYTFARNARARRFYGYHGFVPVAFGFEPTWQLDDVKYRWQAPARAYDEAHG